MVADFCRLGANAAGINIDGWLNLPHVRFGKKRPEEHFYRSAIRFDEMFERLVLPLKANRTYRVEFDFAEETATSFRRQTYDFRDVDVAVVEGIFLLKIEHRKHFDLSFWVDCTFETAMERALSRRQEALSDEETRRAYETIYFPAQRIHFTRDNPRKAAGAIVRNDWRLAG
jgi:uridine kinase